MLQRDNIQQVQIYYIAGIDNGLFVTMISFNFIFYLSILPNNKNEGKIWTIIGPIVVVEMETVLKILKTMICTTFCF